MKLKTLTLAALCISPALISSQPKGTAIAFSLEEGSTLTKTFTSQLEMTLDDMGLLMNGQESPAQPDIDMQVSATTETTVTDEYVKLRGGAPAQLQRTYDTLAQGQDIEMEIDVMGQVQNNDVSVGATSELEGSTVVFRWNEDDSEYVATFPDSDGDEELLEGLREDMDLRALLPGGEVSEGDEWVIAPLDMRDVMSPGGDLKLVPEESDGADAFGGMSPEMGGQDDWFNEDMEGEITATFQGTRETEDGVRVAVIVYAIEISNGVDITEETREGLESQDLPPGVDEMEINSTDIEVAIEGEATLLWNLAEGYLHSFDLGAEIEFLVDSSMNMSVQGMDMEIENSMEFSGNMTLQASAD